VFWVLSAKLGLSASHIIMVAGGACFVGITLFLYSHKNTSSPTLGAQFISNAKQKPFSPLFSDTTGKRLNRIKALVGARLLAKWLSPQLGIAKNTAILLPATVGGALVNIALSFLGKTSVNLNFSLGQESLQAALKQADVEHIITSRAFLAKLNISEADGMIFVEDAKKAISPITRLSALLQALLMPTVILQRLWLSSATVPTDTATILFSSGSTATPKGVCLSHENILSNINSVRVLLNKAEGKESYALTGILPFFHSFGFTVCVWLPSITGRRIAYHPNPLESKTVADMIAQEKCAILVCTPTFARQYVQAGKDGALQSVRLVITGGEKLNATTAQVLKAALPDAHILQGYGCTELGPVVAVNMPDSHQMGSVGRPIPSVSVQVMDVSTGELLPPNQEGLVRVKSPAQMQGYYQNATLTNSVLQDGWYNTGDIGFMGSDGFLHITDRLSRFSKIGGEMVPHGKIEAVIEEILGEKAAVVVAVEDAQRGERLCVLLASVAYTPAQLFAALQQTDLPKLWIPRENSIFQVDAIPVLPTGKVDLRACKELVEAIYL
jgi:acyl-[acyl-carrier-protein]-phospholipid O-acyltransferase/long-chain-fatty-acid--[acyl-carrier-protein] ligase